MIVPGSELDRPDSAKKQALDTLSLIITESITSVGHRAPLLFEGKLKLVFPTEE